MRGGWGCSGVGARRGAAGEAAVPTRGTGLRRCPPRAPGAAEGAERPVGPGGAGLCGDVRVPPALPLASGISQLPRTCKVFV